MWSKWFRYWRILISTQGQNQTDYIIINGRWWKSLKGVCVKRGTDCGSDHHLVIGKIKLKLRKVVKQQHNRKAYNIQRLSDQQTRQQFNITLRNKYQVQFVLQIVDDNIDNIGPDLNQQWNKVKTIYTETTVKVLGIRDSNRKKWISDTKWNVIEKRRATKSKCNQTRSDRMKEKFQM